MGETLVTPQPTRSETQARTEGRGENKGRLARVAEAAIIKAKNTAKALRKKFTGSSLTTEQKLGTIAGLNRVDQAGNGTAIDQVRTQEIGLQNKETRATLRARAKETWRKTRAISRDTSDIVRGVFSRGEAGFVARDAVFGSVIEKVITAADQKLKSKSEALRQKITTREDTTVAQFTEAGKGLVDTATNRLTSRLGERTSGKGGRVANYFRDKGAKLIDGVRAEFATVASEYHHYKTMKYDELAHSGRNRLEPRSVKVGDNQWETLTSDDPRYRQQYAESVKRYEFLESQSERHRQADVAHYQASSMKRRADALRAEGRTVPQPA